MVISAESRFFKAVWVLQRRSNRRYTSSMIFRSVRSSGRPCVSFCNCFCSAGAEVMSDEPVPVLEQFRHAPFLPGNQPGLALMLLAGPATRLLGDLRGQLLAEFRQCVQHRFGDLLEDMELKDLVAGRGPQFLDYTLHGPE